MRSNWADRTKPEYKFSVEELIEQKELQKLQEEFCKVAEVCVFCTDAEGVQKTAMTGAAEHIRLMEGVVEEDKIKELLLRVGEGSLEEQAVEFLEPDGIYMAAFSVKIEGSIIMNWVVLGCDILEERFYDILDLLRESSKALMKNRISCISAEAESRRSRFSEIEMGESLREVAATTEIVQLLDNNEDIETIMGKLLKIVGEHLAITCAYIFEVYQEKGVMDVMVEWCREGYVSEIEKTKGVSALSILYTEKPLVISSNSLQNEAVSEELEREGMKAVIIFPVMGNDNRKMYACFFQKGTTRIWKTNEVKFVSDAVKILQSVLTRRIQKNSIASSYASLEAILDNVGCSVYVKDFATGKVLFANRQLKKTFRKELEEGSFDRLIHNEYAIDKKTGSYEIYAESKNEWYDLLFTEISWVDGSKACLCSLYDITDKKIYQRKIEQQAWTDFLTGLYNRMCCERDLACHIDEAKKLHATGGLLYLDLDDFKHINDGLGHQYGDVLLKSISHSLQRIEGIEKTCYRMGGDEFVIIVPPQHYAEFDRILEDIKAIFDKPWFLKDADYYCTMSMGMVTFPDGSENVQDLIKKADIAMYEAKKGGKNRVAMYSDNIDSMSGRRLDMEKHMREATVSGYKEFEVYFQPIIDIQKDGTPCTGAEALIRWNSAELGFIPPADFIPLAEYLGLINPIGNHVLYEACEICKEWNDTGHPEYKVNVNLSVVQLLQADIVEIVKRTLQQTGINPHNLTLEVTESLAINDMERMKEILSSIKALGVRIALDDFGTGYSSLNHIREIPFDVIKVDQSFVKDLTEEAYTQSFIKMVAELAETIGVSICVEGIETKEQYKVLEGMKVRLVQGYYFDRPMKRSEFEKKYVVVT